MNLWPGPNLTLDCYPTVPEHVARAWDAADDYLIQEIDKQQTTLIINDRHGALTCAIPQSQTWIDSACTVEAIKNNLKQNIGQTCATQHQNIFTETEIDSQIRQVVIKIPKNLNQLKFWMYHCQQTLPEDTAYYLSGMAKHIPVSWLQWLQANCGDYEQFRIVKKARLMRMTRPRISTAPMMESYRHDQLELSALPGVFARQKLDIGSQILLQHLKQPFRGNICDLGCGNGLLGLTIKQRHPDCNVILTDDSYLAVRSAQANTQSNQITADCRHGNVLSAVEEPLDWIVCNPPFHDGHKELMDIAFSMFDQGAASLTADGRMLIVANRHLPYMKKLRQLFSNVELLSKDPKFNVFLCSSAKHAQA